MMGAGAGLKISYSDDEVKVFHPIVEARLKDFISKQGLSHKYEVEHHPEGTTGSIPDFVIKEKSSGKWVFVIEVKRTPSSVESIRTWDQARSYVVNNRAMHWSSGKKPYFMVTNIELSYILCERTGVSAQFCLLKNGEKDCGIFGSNANPVIQQFDQAVLPVLFELLSTQLEEYSDHLRVILDDFVGLQEELTLHIINEIHGKRLKNKPSDFGFKNYSEYKKKLESWRMLNDPRAEKLDVRKVCREIARDALFRVFFYEYCREYFKTLSLHTTLKPIQANSKSNLETSIRLSLENLHKIDFSQIIKDRLVKFIPENIDDKTFAILDKFVQRLRTDISDAIKESGSPAHLLNLITQDERLYPWEEVNSDGKVMTDSELADMVTSLCFRNLDTETPPMNFDPGCGAGNLSLSVYDQLRSRHPSLTHNQILACLHGCEVDGFMGKLAVLSLTMRSPKEVDKNTAVDLQLSDFFEIGRTSLRKHDLVVMNPPFLRNDNKVAPLKAPLIEKKISKIVGTKSVMSRASQPNMFFYFVELATHLLKEDGVAGFFLMSSVLKSDNGVYLKDFLLKNFDMKYFILVPKIFFLGYQVTPCIFIGKRKRKPDSNNEVKFVRIIDKAFFSSKFEEIEGHVSSGNMTIKLKSQGDLRPTDNWRQYLVTAPDFYDVLRHSQALSSLGTVFPSNKRGGLANEGNGVAFFFPWSSQSTRKVIGDAIIDRIPSRFRSLAINNSDIPQHYTLTEDDLSRQECLSIDSSIDIRSSPELNEFFRKFKSKFELPKKWTINDFPSKAQLIIPRASRKTHAVFLNPFWNDSDVYFSSNFGAAWDCNLNIVGLDNDEILQYIAGFLNSSFGQIFFELESDNREGLRKIEVTPMMQKILIPVKGLNGCIEQIRNIIDEFNSLEFGLTGLEGTTSNPRSRLDIAVARLLLEIEPSLERISSSPETLAEAAENSLQEIVRDRKEV